MKLPFSNTSLRWMFASCVVPVGFYIGLSVRESNDSETKEEQRIELLIRERLLAKKQHPALETPTTNNR